MYSLKKFDNGFEYLEINNKHSSAKIALQGAHLFEYKREGKADILWLSEESAFESGVAIRGGIPICWPRFGVLDKGMPAHGFTRTALFELVSVEEKDDAITEVLFCLTDSSESHTIWDYTFRLEVKFIIGETLEIELTSKNLDAKEMLITEALHTYFRVSDIADVEIRGLEGCTFIDTLEDRKSSEERSIKIDAECDRVYLDVQEKISLHDKNAEIMLTTKGASSAIVWNPWIEKGSRMSGMRADAYKEFVCIESANAFDNAYTLKPSTSHTLHLNLD